jgi:hypothetical protein
VLMYFSPKQYAELKEVLLLNGAEPSGRGIVGKEEALIAALRKAAPGVGNVQPMKAKAADEPPDDSE